MAGTNKAVFDSDSFANTAQQEAFDRRYRLAETWAREHGDKVRYFNSGEIELPPFASWLSTNGLSPLPDEFVNLAKLSSGTVKVGTLTSQPQAAEADAIVASRRDNEIDLPVRGRNQPAVWQAEARRVADRLARKDKGASAHSSKGDLGDRVAKELRERGIDGPNGPLSGGTITREALGGSRWKHPTEE
jgi:hypothetical protein